MAQLDLRLVRLSLEISGQLKVYNAKADGIGPALQIESTGCKFASPLQNEAEVKIFNLTKTDRDYQLTECSPYNKNRTPKKLILEAGRVSTGLSKLYEGNITACTPTQPPDIGLVLKCQTGAFQKGKIVSVSQPGVAQLSDIARGVAADNALSLNFEADDKGVSNYRHAGAALKQVGKLADAGDYDAYVDDGTLIVKNRGVPLKGQMRVLSASSGMIGIPEPTEHGVKVLYLLDNQSKLGGALRIESALYPALNGNYTIYKLGWSVSTRSTPFYWIAECSRRSDGGAVVRPNPVPKHTRGKK